MVRILYFAVVRERLGRDSEEIALPAGATGADLLAALEARHPALGGLRGAIKLAVNEELVGLDKVIADGDVVALIPPVAGGAGGLFRVTDAPVLLDEVVRAVEDEAHGAVVT